MYTWKGENGNLWKDRLTLHSSLLLSSFLLCCFPQPSLKILASEDAPWQINHAYPAILLKAWIET